MAVGVPGVPGPLPPYLRPDRLEDALRLLAQEPRLVLAGGTDVYPAFASRPIDRPVLDITALPGLRGVTDDGDAWRIPALTTWTDVAEADLPPAFDGLRAAARTIGGRQIQNAGTVCGNVVNASPASDGCRTSWRSTPRWSSRRRTAAHGAARPVRARQPGDGSAAGRAVVGLRVPKSRATPARRSGSSGPGRTS